ncbi:MAG: NTP transferase domain-containing protein [Oscillospiraceae bacterium]|jgi:CTP:phosphocholine cytidylyltransferase-like protein/thiamine kinase-like enzyme|nr:NTP transferase domain-containing protein [Oscillospiraceae bacterium]
MKQHKVDNAIILAAGIGERAVPLTMETPKGLLKVFGVPMLERQIEQLLEKGISEIIIVVGYMKECFDYLIDKYGVKLIFNPEFASKNNLSSLYCVREHLRGSYLLMSDNYIENNIFSQEESDSWFSGVFYSGKTEEWVVSEYTQAGAIRRIDIGGADAFAIQGPAYFSPEFSAVFRDFLEEYYAKTEAIDYYWEHILKLETEKLPPMFIKDTTGNVHEFENLEELRQYDRSYFTETNNRVIAKIAEVLSCSHGDIHDISVVKTGMNNRSFKFYIGDKPYIFRMPGADMSKLVDREIEKQAYDKLAESNITDKTVYFDGKTGIKISEFLENSRMADCASDEDLKLSMQSVHLFHDQNVVLTTDRTIETETYRYIDLANELNAIRFSDFDEILLKMQELFEIKKKLGIKEGLCHGDYAHVNILILPDGRAKIIDLEFVINCDPILDVSMYAIFAEFERERIDLCLEYYLGRKPTREEQFRLYLYVSLSAFRWAIWAEYKQAGGSEFGDYTLTQIRFAKDYYNILKKEFPEFFND